MHKIKGISIDRIIRGVAGVVLVVLGIVRKGGDNTLLLSLGAVMVFTAVTGVCGFGSSCAVEPVKVKIKEEDEK